WKRKHRSAGHRGGSLAGGPDLCHHRSEHGSVLLLYSVELGQRMSHRECVRIARVDPAHERIGQVGQHLVSKAPSNERSDTLFDGDILARDKKFLEKPEL